MCIIHYDQILHPQDSVIEENKAILLWTNKGVEHLFHFVLYIKKMRSCEVAHFKQKDIFICFACFVTWICQGSKFKWSTPRVVLVCDASSFADVFSLCRSNPIQTISSGRVRPKPKPRKVADHLIDVRRKKKSTSNLFYRTPPVCNFSYMFKTKAC